MKWPYLLLIMALSLSSAELNLTVQGIVDNREYFNAFADDGTIFGLRETGTATFGSGQNQFTAGLTWLQEFGSPVEKWVADPILFYIYNGTKGGRLLFGSFPRTNLLFSPLFFDSRFTAYRSHIEGFDFRYTFARGAISAWVDWDGRQSESTHESFFVGLSGKERFGKMGIEQYVHYRHIASRAIEEHDAIRENSGAHLIFSYNDTSLSQIDTIRATAELIASADHETREESWNNPIGAQVTGRIIFHKWGLGGKVYREIFADKYSHSLDNGAPFYNTKQFGELDLVFYPVQTENLSMKFNWIVTLVDGKTENQQLFLLNGAFGKRFNLKNQAN